MARNTAKIALISAGVLIGTSTVLGQTDAQCLASFRVQPSKSVTYIAVNARGQFKVMLTTTSCSEAEEFRERMYVNMDKSLYDSETMLKSRLNAAKSALESLNQDLNTILDAAGTKTKIAAASGVVSMVWAISTTAACATAVVDGVGVAACGPAARAAIATIAAWSALGSFMGDAATLKANARIEIQKHQAQIASVAQQLNATKAESMKDNYSELFTGICRAVYQQCR